MMLDVADDQLEVAAGLQISYLQLLDDFEVDS